MSDTTQWKKNRTFAESIRSLEREVPDEQNWFSINKIKEKIKKINEKSKGFTKLPTLENIYEKEPFTSQKRRLDACGKTSSCLPQGKIVKRSKCL